MMSDLDQLYQDLILDHYKRPRNSGCLPHADRRAEGHNPLCGDHVTVFLKVRDNVVEEVTFQGSGCAISTASASMMTEILKGRTLEEAKRIFEKFHALVTGSAAEQDAGADLGKLEVFSSICRYPVRVKCATLAWHTFKAAAERQAAPVSTE